MRVIGKLGEKQKSVKFQLPADEFAEFEQIGINPSAIKTLADSSKRETIGQALQILIGSYDIDELSNLTITFAAD